MLDIIDVSNTKERIQGLDIFEQRSIQNPEISISVSHFKNTMTLSISDNDAWVEVSPIESVFNTFITTNQYRLNLSLFTLCQFNRTIIFLHLFESCGVEFPSLDSS